MYLKGRLVVVVFDVLVGSSEQQHSGTAVLQSQQQKMKQKYPEFTRTSHFYAP